MSMTRTKLLYQARNWPALLRSAKVMTGVKLAKMCGVATFHGSLSAVVCKRVGDSAWNGGRLEKRFLGWSETPLGILMPRTELDLGLLGKRVVTDEGVNFLVDDWDDNTTDITNMNFHDSGTGVAAEAASDADLGTPAGPTTRATGTKSQPSANVIRSVGTIAYTSTLAITEHGLFSTAARATTELWDRTVFTAINVVNGDSIQFTYDGTMTAGS